MSLFKPLEPLPPLTRDEAIQIIRKFVDYGDMSVEDMLENFRGVVEARPSSEVSIDEIKKLIATHAPETPRNKVLCQAQTPDNKHVCVREKDHTGWHKDGGGFKWTGADVAVSRASRVSAIREDGTCKNHHQLLINGDPTKPTKDYSVSKKGEIRCKACNREYQKKFREKSQQPVGILDEAIKKIGLESLGAAWFEFKTKFKKDVVQVLGKILELPSLDPEVYDYLVQASQAPTVGVETPGKVQGEPEQSVEPVQPGKFVDPFADLEAESKPQVDNANIF